MEAREAPEPVDFFLRVDHQEGRVRPLWWGEGGDRTRAERDGVGGGGAGGGRRRAAMVK